MKADKIRITHRASEFSTSIMHLMSNASAVKMIQNGQGRTTIEFITTEAPGSMLDPYNSYLFFKGNVLGYIKEIKSDGSDFRCVAEIVDDKLLDKLIKIQNNKVNPYG